MDAQGVSILILILVPIIIAIVAIIGYGHQQRTYPERNPTRKIPSPPRTFALVLETEGGEEQIIPLTKGEVRIGRAHDNDIPLNDRYVSRHHAILRYTPPYFEIIDLDSANGVWVNQKRVYRQILKPGDVLQIGATRFHFKGEAIEAITPGPTSPVAPAEPLPVQGAFRLEDYVLAPLPGGVGGQAQVYKAVPKRGGPPLAVKVFRQPDPYLYQKFQQVIRQVMNLRHPHIVQLFDYGAMSDGALYLVMEFLPGGSLRDRLRGHPLPLKQAITVAGEVCEALEYAHAHGIIHRDIKPENILFDARGRAKLIDFTAAHFSREMTVTQDGILLGTPYYMSYEQAQGEDVVPASDIYSLGVVLFEMLTGQRPFEGSAMEVIEQHIHKTPPNPRQLNPNIPPHVAEAVLQAMNKDHRRRFRSAREFARAIGYTGNVQQVQPPLPKHFPSAIVLRVYQTGQLIRVNGNQILGRMEINPSDTMISRRHFRIITQAEGTYIEDVGSRNGTFVNGIRVTQPHRLNKGDIIYVGITNIEVLHL